MNCHLQQTRIPGPELERDIARLDAIMYCCRQKYGDGGQWLFGAFSIADAFMAPYVIALENYGAEMTGRAQSYMHTLLNHPDVLGWLNDAQDELDKVRFAKIA
jgi:glutathione S-transferase